jgi:hypothetical protein
MGAQQEQQRHQQPNKPIRFPEQVIFHVALAPEFGGLPSEY